MPFFRNTRRSCFSPCAVNKCRCRSTSLDILSSLCLYCLFMYLCIHVFYLCIHVDQICFAPTFAACWKATGSRKRREWCLVNMHSKDNFNQEDAIRTRLSVYMDRSESSDWYVYMDHFYSDQAFILIICAWMQR